MNTCIQTCASGMEKNLDNVVVSVRLRGADAARFWRVMDEAKARNPYIDKSDVIRELLGLDPPKCLTVKEVQHFRGPGTAGIDATEITLSKPQRRKTG